MDLWFSEHITDNSRFSLRVKEQLFHSKSEFQTIDVYDTFDFGRVMTIDGKFMVTERDEFIYHDMIAHVPLMAHPNPRQVLVIGGGDGGTLREVLKHEGVASVELCEIDAIVIEAARRFFPKLACGLDDPRCQIHVRDGIEHIQGSPQRYDVILVDSTDPGGPAQGLFDAHFYRAVSDALRDDGILVVQSEGPLWAPELVRDIYATLAGIFKVCKLYTFPVPTYPLGLWSFTFASKRHGPFDHFDAVRCRSLADSTHYYNEEIHRAAFALPNFIKRTIEPRRGHAPQ